MPAERLDFTEVARLLNNSRHTQIEVPARENKEGWQIYRGEHRVQTSHLNFWVFNILTHAVKSDVEYVLRNYPAKFIQIVCSPSVAERPHIKALNNQVLGIWTPRDYLLSYIRPELDAYRERLRPLAPPHYIHPRIETTGAESAYERNPVLALLSRREPFPEGGMLGILLAEAGQGKTYLSRYLISILLLQEGVVPIFVDSHQWGSMALEDQRSIWKTIVHTFRHFQSPIPWVEGCEESFLRATLKADVFRIVFDGLDEYLLRHRRAIPPIEVIKSLNQLAEETESRILVTSRTSFWQSGLNSDDIEWLANSKNTRLFSLLPFEYGHAKSYFDTRLKSPEKVKNALDIFNLLRASNAPLAGRGFVLSMIADLADSDAAVQAQRGATGLLWLMEALCRREEEKQDLTFDAQDQLAAFRLLAAEISTGEDPTSLLLLLALSYVRNDLPESTVEDTIVKLRVHPLLRWESSDQWSFSEEQVQVALLAQHIDAIAPNELSSFVKRLRVSAGLRQDLVGMLIDLTCGLPLEDTYTKIADVVDTMRNAVSPGPAETMRLSDCRYLGGLLALMAVGRFQPTGSPRRDRISTLLRLTKGSTAIRQLNFFETIGSFDFSGITFDGCLFNHATWDNCLFDRSTRFRRCHFVGGSAPVRSEGFGSVIFEECTFDEEAESWIRSIQVREGAKKYTRRNLRSDLGHVLRKFIGKTGVGLRSVEEANLHRGPIGSSKHKDEILRSLSSTVLDTHHISGVDGVGYHIRSEAVDDVRFFVENNNFTGVLRRLFEDLCDELKITE